MFLWNWVQISLPWSVALYYRRCYQNFFFRLLHFYHSLVLLCTRYGEIWNGHADIKTPKNEHQRDFPARFCLNLSTSLAENSVNRTWPVFYQIFMCRTNIWIVQVKLMLLHGNFKLTLKCQRARPRKPLDWKFLNWCIQS